VDLKLGHHAKDGVEIIDVQAKSTCIPRRGCGSCSSTWSAWAATSSSSTWTRSGSSTPPASGVLVGGLRRVRAHDGSLDLVCTRQRILKILKITGLTEVFGIYETVDQAIAATKGRR
jgi:anti-sigma B factor antagonist